MPTAVIDLGSNSVRLLVADVGDQGQLIVRADARCGLRLLRRVKDGGALPEDAIQATTQTLAGMAAIARNAGADTLAGVATAALREASNADEVIATLRAETGVEVRTIDGDEEARLATRGAVYGLPVDAGLSIDIGGGSLELAGFTRDDQGPSWSMPLGALRLNDQFLTADPPKRGGIQSLRQHVRAVLQEAGVPDAGKRHDFVGTGGTIRAVAKIARNRRSSPVQGVHGYRLTRDDVEAVASSLEGLTRDRIAKTTGVNPDRAISLTAGVSTLLETMHHIGIHEMLVSAKGLREGLVLTLADAATPSWKAVREISVTSLADQFTVHSQQRASWRRAIARALMALLVDAPGEDLEATLRDAATLIDIGRSVDFYEKHAHTAEIILTADLAGFSQRDRAMVAAAIEKAGDFRATLGRFKAVLNPSDMRDVERAGLLLALADGIEPRTHADDDLKMQRREGKGEVSVLVPLAAPWRPAELIRHTKRLFGKRLIIGDDGGGVSIDVR